MWISISLSLCFILKQKEVELTADLFFYSLLACTQALTNQILSDICSRIRVLNCLLVNILPY